MLSAESSTPTPLTRPPHRPAVHPHTPPVGLSRVANMYLHSPRPESGRGGLVVRMFWNPQIRPGLATRRPEGFPPRPGSTDGPTVRPAGRPIDRLTDRPSDRPSVRLTDRPSVRPADPTGQSVAIGTYNPWVPVEGKYQPTLPDCLTQTVR